MHLIEVCLPNAAAFFLGYAKEKACFIKGVEKTLSQLKKKNPKPFNVKLILDFCFAIQQL